MTSTFNEVKDSGERQDFDTGAHRDTQDGKPRYALVPQGPLYRLAMHYTNGANKYGENNWTKGMPMSRALESLMRHVESFREGDRSEDHLAAVAWNAFALMWYEDNMSEMDDLDEYLARMEDDEDHDVTTRSEPQQETNPYFEPQQEEDVATQADLDGGGYSRKNVTFDAPIKICLSSCNCPTCLPGIEARL